MSPFASRAGTQGITTNTSPTMTTTERVRKHDFYFNSATDEEGLVSSTRNRRGMLNTINGTVATSEYMVTKLKPIAKTAAPQIKVNNKNLFKTVQVH